MSQNESVMSQNESVMSQNGSVMGQNWYKWVERDQNGSKVCKNSKF